MNVRQTSPQVRCHVPRLRLLLLRADVAAATYIAFFGFFFVLTQCGAISMTQSMSPHDEMRL
jgi:hypothetical protein